jgi:nitrate reductase NapE
MSSVDARGVSQQSPPDPSSSPPGPDGGSAPYTRAQELRSFLFLTVVMAPAITFLAVAGYGFLVWMGQLVAGPPTGG